MPVLDAVVCASCGVLVKVNDGKICGPDVYYCRGCFQFSPQKSPPVVYVSTALTPKWVEAIGVVSFDLEIGQTLTHLFPPLPFSFVQETDLAFLCFPDTNSTEYGQHVHHFIYPFDKRLCDRTRTSIERPAAFCPLKTSAKCKVSKSPFTDDWATYHEEYFCSSLYRRKRDPSIERGAQQKAVVIISMYSFPHIFERILETCCEELLDSLDTEGSLRGIYEDISRWPAPLPTMQCSGFTLRKRILTEFRVPYYTPERFGPRWCESGFGRKQRQRIARAQLLEVLESPTPDISRIQGKLNECTVGPNAPDDFSDYILKELRLEPTVSKWNPEDYLNVIRFLRTGKAKLNFKLIDKDDSDANLTSDANSVAALFRHINYVSPEVAVIQNSELRQSREFAKELLCHAEGSSVLLEEDSADNMFEDFDIHSVLFPHLNRLWKLWELLITGEPLYVVGSSVNRVSACCLCLYSLLSPMLFNGVVRPYVTVNNSEVDYLKPDGCSKIPIIAGSTNPFFVRHWMDCQHFLSLGDLNDDELQTHKTLPHSSSKRPKLQFKLKSNMFTSRHFWIKSEKHVWDGNNSNFLSTRVKGKPLCGNMKTTNGEGSNLTKVIRRIFLQMTKQFLLPLEQALECEFGKFPALFFLNDNAPSNDIIFSALRHGDSKCLPLHMFKSSQDMFDVYINFMKTATYKSWMQENIQTLRRAVILDASSLEDILRLESNPEKRYAMIMSLQSMLQEQVERPVIDVKLLQKLVKLTECLIPLRSILTRRWY